MGKTFETSPREKVFEIFSDSYYEIYPKLARVIKNIYIGGESVVRNSYGFSDLCLKYAGVWQGELLLPLLFIIFMDKCIKEVSIDEELGMVLTLQYRSSTY